MQFIIINEQLAQRCEICHKNDQFMPLTNICNRCQNITASTFIITTASNRNLPMLQHANNIVWQNLDSTCLQIIHILGNISILLSFILLFCLFLHDYPPYSCMVPSNISVTSSTNDCGGEDFSMWGMLHN